ncbi:MAG TPA: NifU N-terminal domain-containing protein [Candidatus Nanoarchaeia archaeon]|nr:NifU N-terminal domain-containing protein [Candidatus Nanoarchaeia archaeon]
MYFSKLTASLAKFARRIFRRLALHLPWRMAIGKFGILLCQIGRFLQVKYANWNSQFRLKVEYSADNWVDVHVSEMITTREVTTFRSKDSNHNFSTPLSKALFEIKGVVSFHFFPYKLQIEKAGVYYWSELLPQIEASLFKHLAGAGK